MHESPVLTCTFAFQRGQHGRKRLALKPDGEVATALGRIPRVSRLVALAVKLDAQIRAGELRDWADVARFGHVTRARTSQIAALTLLAPDIIEAILHLPLVERGRDSITERHLRAITSESGWRKQRRMWRELLKRISE